MPTVIIFKHLFIYVQCKQIKRPTYYTSTPVTAPLTLCAVIYLSKVSDILYIWKKYNVFVYLYSRWGKNKKVITNCISNTQYVIQPQIYKGDPRPGITLRVMASSCTRLNLMVFRFCQPHTQNKWVHNMYLRLLCGISSVFIFTLRPQ